MRKIVKNTSSGQRAQQLINPITDDLHWRTARNGSWYNIPEDAQVSEESVANGATFYNNLIGFRLVRNAS